MGDSSSQQAAPDPAELARLVTDARDLVRSYLDVWARYDTARATTGDREDLLEVVSDSLAMLAGLCDARMGAARPPAPSCN